MRFWLKKCPLCKKRAKDLNPVKFGKTTFTVCITCEESMRDWLHVHKEGFRK